MQSLWMTTIGHCPPSVYPLSTWPCCMCRVSFRGGGGWEHLLPLGFACLPLDMLRILFHMYMSINSSLYKALVTQYMVNYVCVKFYQIASNVRSKVKISWGSMPLDPPSLPHALHMNMYLPTDDPYNPILPPSPHLGKKLKETPIWLIS